MPTTSVFADPLAQADPPEGSAKVEMLVREQVHVLAAQFPIHSGH